MKGTKFSKPLQFIQTVGISGFVTGVKTGMIAPEQGILALEALSASMDSYVQAVPMDFSANDLRLKIKNLLPKYAVTRAAHLRTMDLLLKNQEIVDIVVGKVWETQPFKLRDELRWIPPGEFMMGSANSDRFANTDEKPLRAVFIGGFYMLDHPVTNSEFRKFLKSKGLEDMRHLPQMFDGENHPAVCVRHEEAVQYSSWLGGMLSKEFKQLLEGRLPTEAEWEKAAKGPSGREFTTPATHEEAHFGAHYTRDVDHPDTYANSYGMKDIIGNVWEMTDGVLQEDHSHPTLRGGSWRTTDVESLRAAFRDYISNTICEDLNIGFRPIILPHLVKSI